MADDDPPPPRKRQRAGPGPRLDRQMNRGLVLHPHQFRGACRSVLSGCSGQRRCVYRPHHGDGLPQHTCRETALDRWQCALHRLVDGILRRIRRGRYPEDDEGRPSSDPPPPPPPPQVVPELLDFDALELQVIGLMRHQGPPPVLPVINTVEHPNPRAYYGDDVRSYTEAVASHLRHPHSGRHRFTLEQVASMRDTLPLGAFVERVYNAMKPSEQRAFRRRLDRFRVHDTSIRSLARTLPDVAWTGEPYDHDDADLPSPEEDRTPPLPRRMYQWPGEVAPRRGDPASASSSSSEG